MELDDHSRIPLQSQFLLKIISARVLYVPCIENLPVCGGSTLRNFYTGNLILCGLYMGLVRDRPGLSYTEGWV
jgi:hypothetical protein